MFLDVYDDPSGHILKSKLPTADVIPDFVKTAEDLTERLDDLPDGAFALVALDQGRKMRKYAMTDAGNTAMSVIYFLENGDRLPEEAQKVAAARLVEACEHFELEPPMALKLASKNKKIQMARILEDGVKGLGKPKKHSLPRLVKGADVSGSDIMPKSSSMDKTAISARGVRGAVKDWTSSASKRRKALERAHSRVAGSLRKTASEDKPGFFSRLVGTKKARDYEIGNDAALKELGRRMQSAEAKIDWSDAGARKHVELTKQKPWLEGFNRRQVAQMGPGDDAYFKKNWEADNPYVDITGKTAPARRMKKHAQNYCIPSQQRFPIDGMDQIKKANAWFVDFWPSLTIDERREYAQNLEKRASAVGILKVHPMIQKYGGGHYGDSVKVAVEMRRQYWRDGEAERSLLDGLMDKQASVEPEVFAQALRQFDEATGLDAFWDQQIYDPYLSTFGTEKVAEWKFSTHGSSITEAQLKDLTLSCREELADKFGEELTAALQKTPTKIFDSLPLPQKRIIMRMANDPQPTFR